LPIMERKAILFAAAVIMVSIGFSLSGLQAQTASAVWLRGYQKTIESQRLYYHSPYPGQLPALLVRASDDESRLGNPGCSR